MQAVRPAALAALCACLAAAPHALSQAPQPGEHEPGYEPKEATPFLYHERHLAGHLLNRPHPTVAPDGTRFYTTRQSDIALPLPTETEAFTFAIFGDRTGGPDLGVNVLADAVRDVNLFEPDLVMTVGDLIDGYNQTPEWLRENREYKAIMGELLCPWFPVAGNHDIYWRGEDRPENEHEANYEMHFGPLWYAFEHKNSNFIALFTDEGDPKTGEKSFSKPSTQAMSPEQKAFLADALERGADLDHQFVFVHHPRWLGGGYGDDWMRNVHPMLVEAGNVRAVFAGHIHRMRHDRAGQGPMAGPLDGIEYVTLATVGGGQGGAVPEAGWLHHYHLVTVRPQQIALTAYPVGSAMNVREITGELSDALNRQRNRGATVDGVVRFTPDGAARGELTVTVRNVTGTPLDLSIAPTSTDSRWMFRPDHAHEIIQPGEERAIGFLVGRPAGSADAALGRLEIAVDADAMAPTARYTIPTAFAQAPVDLASVAVGGQAADNAAMDLDGDGDAIRVASDAASVHQGPFTLECWFNARDYAGRTGLVTKTQNSEYGFFVSDGELWFAAHLGGAYRERRVGGQLQTGTWHHVAGVYDGEQLRTYLDGELVASLDVDPTWQRRTSGLPLYIGADPDGGGRPMSFFDGRIDEVRLSTVARYRGDRFQPQRRLRADGDTRLLYTFDAPLGDYVVDASGNGHHAATVGDPAPAPAN